MPDAINLGHVLLALAAIAAIVAVANLATALHHSGHERGTPQYARSRMARRNAFYALGLALVLTAVCLSPLCSVTLMELKG